jgi:hypothetical protein
MHETIMAAGHNAQPQLDAAAEAKLCLLARWILHCHERTRQRGQLGMLAPAFADAEPERTVGREVSDAAGWA